MSCRSWVCLPLRISHKIDHYLYLGLQLLLLPVTVPSSIQIHMFVGGGRCRWDNHGLLVTGRWRFCYLFHEFCQDHDDISSSKHGDCRNNNHHDLFHIHGDSERQWWRQFVDHERGDIQDEAAHSRHQSDSCWEVEYHGTCQRIDCQHPYHIPAKMTAPLQPLEDLCQIHSSSAH